MDFKKLFQFSITMFVLSILDILTTIYALEKYPQLREGNGFMSSIISMGYISFVAFKMFAVCVIVGMYKHIQQQNKNIAKVGQCILIALIILVVVSSNASAFSDNFNDSDISDWTIYGSWTTSTVGSFDGSPYALSVGHAASTWYMEKTSIPTDKYFEFSINGTWTNAGTSYHEVQFKRNSTGAVNSIRMNGDATISGMGFSFVPFSVPRDAQNVFWVKFVIIESGTNYNFTAYNQAGSVINTQTVPISINIYDSTTIRLNSVSVGTVVSRFDNIVVSSSPPNAAPALIAWNSQNYVKDDSGGYTWNINDDLWTETYLYIPYEYRAEIFQNDVLDESIALGSQTGTQFYTFASTGSYIIKLMKYYNAYYYLGLAGTEIANSSIVVRNQGDSYLFSPPYVSSGVSSSINFSYGMTLPVSVSNFMKVSYYTGSSFEAENNYYLNTVCGGICTAGTQYTQNAIFEKDGLYKIELFGLHKGLLKTIQVTAVFTGVMPTINLTTSFLNTSKSVYFLDEYADVSYGIDSINYSTYKIYIELYNYDILSGTNKIQVTNQLDTKDFLFRLTKQLSNEWVVVPGNNKWSIWSYFANDTKNKEITFKNITIAAVNLNGYGLAVKREGCLNEDILIKTIIPSKPLFTHLIISDGTDIILNESKTIVHTFKTLGVYTISLQNDGVTEMISSIDISLCAPVSSPGDEELIGSTCSVWDGYTSMLGMGINNPARFAFATLIIVFAIAMGLFLSKGNFSAGLVFGFLPYAYFTYISILTACGEYMPAWVIVFIACIIAIKMRWF